MSKYADYDVKLLEMIKGGCTEFTVMTNRLVKENQAFQPEGDAWRVTDRRLQALRKAGLITYDKFKRKWSVPADQPA